MPSKTRSGAQARRGRPKADPMSCATKSYKKSHPTTSLMSCSASKTCKAVPGKAGKRCTMKLRPGRKAGPKKEVRFTERQLARGFKQLPGSISSPVKTKMKKKPGRSRETSEAIRIMKELPQVTPEKYVPRASELMEELPKSF